MSSNDLNNSQNSNNTELKRSAPISINPGAFRRRSASVSSSSSSSSPSSNEPSTPNSSSLFSNKAPLASPSTSPILSYFLSQPPISKSPPNSPATFPFRRSLGTAPVLEEEPGISELRAPSARRATIVGRFPAQPPIATPLTEAHSERGVGLLRRLSLGSALVKPQLGPMIGSQIPRSQSPPSYDVPPNSAVALNNPPIPLAHPHPTKHTRAATISNDARRPRRVPSPMGERILKGHFDGFN